MKVQIGLEWARDFVLVHEVSWKVSWSFWERYSSLVEKKKREAQEMCTLHLFLPPSFAALDIPV